MHDLILGFVPIAVAASLGVRQVSEVDRSRTLRRSRFDAVATAVPPRRVDRPLHARRRR